MNKIVNIVFPFYENWKANAIIKTRMFPKNDQGKDVVPMGVLKDIKDSSNISTEKLKELYDGTFKIKEKLEDKAKTNIIGITISVSLIVGSTGLLSSINTKYENLFVTSCAIAFLIASVTYMIISGWLVIHMMIDENEIYNVRLSSVAKNEGALRDDYDKCIAQNQSKNIIRNNYVFSSYACIRNSLVCLFALFLFIVIPNNLSNKYQSNNLEIHKSQIYTFSFKSSTIDYLKENDVRDIVERSVLCAMEKEQPTRGDGIFGIVNEKNMLFIRYEVIGNSIKVLSLEPYTTSE